MLCEVLWMTYGCIAGFFFLPFLIQNINTLELVYFPKGKYCVYPRMVYSLAIVMPPG